MVDRNAEALADQLLALPSVDRARLAELLLASIEEREADATAAWTDEIDRRSAGLEGGKSHLSIRRRESPRVVSSSVDCNGVSVRRGLQDS